MAAMRYKKIPAAARPIAAPQPTPDSVLLGMLYLVEVNLESKSTGEKTKHRLLLVGCEAGDIDRKMNWLFDTNANSLFIKSVEKVREKVHFLSTVVTQPDAVVGPVIERDDGSQVIPQQTPALLEPYDPKLYAIGVTTTMLAKDPEHAMRKLGHALVSHASEGKSHSGAKLSADSTVAIEEVPRSNGYAGPRDVSNEVNRARFFRG